MILNILFRRRLKYFRTQILRELLGGAKDNRSLSSQSRRAFNALRSFNMCLTGIFRSSAKWWCSMCRTLYGMSLYRGSARMIYCGNDMSQKKIRYLVALMFKPFWKFAIYQRCSVGIFRKNKEQYFIIIVCIIADFTTWKMLYYFTPKYCYAKDLWCMPLKWMCSK